MTLSLTSDKKRIQSIDLLRGIIMIIMALDHTRDFFHVKGLTGDPLNENTTDVALYATRWITHFCAPTFVFLSGLSAWLQAQRKSKKELSFFLVTRGLWLIIVDLFIMSFAFTADIHYSVFILETLWSIGAGMIVLGLMIWLPFYMILATGIIITLGHNMLDFMERAGDAPAGLWYKILHQQTFYPLGSGHSLFLLYPTLSWIGLILLGYCCGKLFTHADEAGRKKILIWTGVSAIILFLVLRYINKYGDPRPWIGQDNTLKNFFVFMNVEKYPPSLLFLCATIGPMLIVLSLLGKAKGWFVNFASVIGRVPLFYFVVHFFILHAVQIITYFIRGHSFEEGYKGDPRVPFKFAAPGEGFNLFITYLVWIAAVFLMYLLCKQYDRYKQANKQNKWLSYL
jgi:uncharacterized membrane protein